MSNSTTALEASPRYDLFVSHSHRDQAAVHELVTALVENGLRVFVAGDQPAVSWGQDLAKYLASIFPEQTHAAMVVLSASYTASSWCARELDTIVARALENPDVACVLPVRLDDTPVPASVSDLAYIDLRQGSATEVAKLTKKRLEQWEEKQEDFVARLSDEELLRRVANSRDTEAFNVLYQRLYPFVHRFVHLRSGWRPEEADDIALETMYRLWRDADRIATDRGGSARSWLLKVALNAQVDQERGRRRHTTAPLVSGSKDRPEYQVAVTEELTQSTAEAMKTLSEPELTIRLSNRSCATTHKIESLPQAGSKSAPNSSRSTMPKFP